jgi:hypothetical protein
MPGRILQIVSNLLFGAFNKIYFVFFDLRTALIRNNNLFKISCCSFFNFLFAIKTDSDFNITSTSFSPFVKKVRPRKKKCN